MTAADREFLLALMRDRKRLDTVIAAMKRGDRESFEILHEATILFNQGAPVADMQGRLGRLT